MKPSELTTGYQRAILREPPKQCYCQTVGSVRTRNVKCPIHGADAQTAGWVGVIRALERKAEPARPPLAKAEPTAPNVRADGALIILRISGQIRGGKNNMLVTRAGKHIPKKPWAKWRDAKVREVFGQLPFNWSTISEPVAVMLDYVAEDRRRRDQPAILDAIFHILERAEVVADDTLLWVTNSTRTRDKSNAGATITILEPLTNTATEDTRNQQPN